VAVLGADTGGESNLTYTWSAVGPGPVSFSPNGTNAARNATATFTAGGAYTITAKATNTALESESSSVSVSVYRPMTAIVVSPATWATCVFPATQSFSATAVDQFGIAVPTQPAIAWSVLSGGIGSISSSSGLYHTGAVPGTARAKGDSLFGTAAVSVTLPSPTIATPASANPNPVTGKTTSLSALGAYSGAGGAASLTYTWNATGPAPVSFSINGTNAAKNTLATFHQAGSYSFSVDISIPGGGTIATSTGPVAVSLTLSSIAVSPGPSTTPQTTTAQQFKAVAYDQFGAALASQPTFTWLLVAPSVGSVNTVSGLYHSGPTIGTATVKAKSGSISGTVQVTVN
jgi:hypothetical protein